jgi:hypothetical protein
MEIFVMRLLNIFHLFTFLNHIILLFKSNLNFTITIFNLNNLMHLDNNTQIQLNLIQYLTSIKTVTL